MKFARHDAFVVIGFSFSTPSSDHVPDERYTARSSRAGTARYAEPVSCIAGRTTFVPLYSPTVAPGISSFPKIFTGRPSIAMSSRSQSFFAASSSAVVEESVYSWTIFPVRR